MILFFMLALATTYIISTTQLPTIVKNTVMEKYTKFRSLNTLVETQHKNICMIFWVSVSMICKMYWILFLQWLNTSIEFIDKKHVIISYVLHGRIYKFVSKKHKGPSNIIAVLDENKVDVTDIILPFYGPNEDWHNQKLTPEFWDQKLLIFELSTGDIKTFQKHQKIIL